MAYPQSTLEAIVESERSMFFDGEARYGRHFKHAWAATTNLSSCVASVDEDRSDTFGRFFSLMKKHHTLAFLSALRLHKVQAMANLRQVLEAGAGAAYAIANPDVRDFVDIDAFNIMDPSQKLTKKRYRWLDENYPENSKWLASTKEQINNEEAHANIVSGDRTFHDTRDVAELPFFDIEDEYFVKADLWRISRAAITLMDLFYGVTQSVARATGRSVLGFRPNFPEMIGGLAAESNSLLDAIRASDRFKTAMRKEKERSEAKAKLGLDITTGERR